MNPTTFNRKRFFYVSIILIIIVLVPIALLVFKDKLQIPSQSVFKKSTVELKTTYNNPFDKKTQYVNPFQKYKNPFAVSR